MTRHHQPPSEILAQILTRRGGAEDLPYQNEAVWTIRQHILDAVQVLADRRCLPASLRQSRHQFIAHQLLTLGTVLYGVGLPLAYIEGSEVHPYRW